jgi:hypothetical protein
MKSQEIGIEIENLLLNKLDSEELSAFRSLLERYYLAAFDEGIDCERGEIRNEVD